MEKTIFEIEALITKKELSGDYCRLRLSCPPIESSILPGQFLHILCEPKEEHSFYYHKPKSCKERNSHPQILRRPFSLHRINYRKTDDRNQNGMRETKNKIRLTDGIEILYKIKPDGRGTKTLAQRDVGEKVSVLGPLGNGIKMEMLPENLHTVVLIGGGAGIAPLYALADMFKQGGIVVKILAGVNCREELPFNSTDHHQDGKKRTLIEELQSLGVAIEVVCLDEKEITVIDYLCNMMNKDIRLLLQPQSEQKTIAFFACGPHEMLKALAQGFHTCGVDLNRSPCFVLLEEHMACGLGACRSCVCKVWKKDENGTCSNEWEYRRICTEGPLFNLRDIVWE